MIFYNGAKVVTLQIAWDDTVIVFHLAKIRNRLGELPPQFVDFVNNMQVIKLGININGDINKDY